MNEVIFFTFSEKPITYLTESGCDLLKQLSLDPNLYDTKPVSNEDPYNSYEQFVHRIKLTLKILNERL